MNIEQLRALAERLEKATAINAELWGHVSCVLLAPNGSKVEQSPFNGAWVVYEPASYGKKPFRCWEDEPRDIRLFRDAFAWTDAALALVERMFPGAEYEITTLYGVARVSLPLNDNVYGPSYGNDETGNVPLSILRTIVAALISKTEG